MKKGLIDKANVLLKFENKRLFKMLALQQKSTNLVECVELVDFISNNKNQIFNMNLVNTGEKNYNSYKAKCVNDFKNYIKKNNKKSRYEFNTFIKEFYEYILVENIDFNETVIMITGILIFKNNLCLT